MSTSSNDYGASKLPSLNELGNDLLQVTGVRRLKTIALPFLAMGLYGLFAWLRVWPLAVASVMMLSFVTYGSTSHDLVHRTLHLSRRWNDFWLSLIELLSLRSGTAYRLSHLHHHQHLLDESDIEGTVAHGSLTRAIFGGITTQIQLWHWAWQHYHDLRGRLFAEALGIAVLIVLAIAATPWSIAPIVYAGLVIAGSWLFPLITVYIPHEARATEPLSQTRLFRGRLLQLVAFDHLYHLEHHLYPAVPHHHWKALAERLNPHFDRAGVKPLTRLWPPK